MMARTDNWWEGTYVDHLPLPPPRECSPHDLAALLSILSGEPVVTWCAWQDGGTGGRTAEDTGGAADV